MELSVTGRGTTIPPHFQDHAHEKLEHLARFDPGGARVELELRIEKNPRQQAHRDCIELAWHTRAGVIRTAGCGTTAYTALEQALARLTARLHRDHDRKRIHHGGKTPESVAAATARVLAQDSVPAPAEVGYDGAEDPLLVP